MRRNLKVHFLCLVTVLVIFKNTSGKPKNRKCKKSGTLLYEDMACKPITTATGNRCPTSYNCDHLYNNWCEGSERCILRGKEYGLKDKIPHEETAGNCRVACYCNTFPSDGAFIHCASIECPHYMGIQRKPDGCHFKHELDECCPKGTICPPFDNLTKCDVDGHTYTEGQIFHPKHTCLSCICKKGYKGKNKMPFCKSISCGVELGSAHNIREFCAPVYYGEHFCCPMTFLCPLKNERAQDLEVPPRDSCRFGNTIYKIGQKFKRKPKHLGKTVKCECLIPPLISCFFK